jgi:hypothetical protein
MLGWTFAEVAKGLEAERVEVVEVRGAAAGISGGGSGRSGGDGFGDDAIRRCGKRKKTRK